MSSGCARVVITVDGKRGSATEIYLVGEFCLRRKIRRGKSNRCVRSLACSPQYVRKQEAAELPLSGIAFLCMREDIPGFKVDMLTPPHHTGFKWYKIHPVHVWLGFVDMYGECCIGYDICVKSIQRCYHDYIRDSLLVVGGEDGEVVA